MQVEVITIGDELLLGYTVDSNSAHIGRALAAVGARVVRRTTVGDDPDDIVSAIRAALDRTGAVITTGGLGPTADDRTHESVALAFGVPLALREDALAALRERWQGRTGRPMPESNIRQCMLPEGGTVLDNAYGSAPGVWCETAEGAWVATLPGVPREMRGMLADVLVPRLRERLAQSGAASTLPVVRARTVRTTGIAESALADHLAEFKRAVLEVPLAYLPGVEGVDLRLTVSDVPSDAAERMLDAAESVLQARVGEWIYGRDDEDLAAVVLRELKAHAHTIAVAESCTGGLLGARLTAIPGSSHSVVGGIIAYDNRVKTSMLGVPSELLEAHGAVSEPVARAMAAGVRARLGADIGVAITGVAGPSGGSNEKPVGTVWIAVDTANGTHAVKPIFPGDRDDIRARAAQMALDLVRRSYRAS